MVHPDGIADGLSRKSVARPSVLLGLVFQLDAQLTMGISRI